MDTQEKRKRENDEDDVIHVKFSRSPNHDHRYDDPITGQYEQHFFPALATVQGWAAK